MKKKSSGDIYGEGEKASRLKLWKRKEGLRNYDRKISMGRISLCKKRLRLQMSFLTGLSPLKGHFGKADLTDDRTCKVRGALVICK